MKQLSFPCSCLICKRETSSLGIDTHFMRSHGTIEDKQKFLNTTNKLKKNKNIEQYNINPKECLQCNHLIPYDSRNNTFCSHTCSTIYNHKLPKLYTTCCKFCNKPFSHKLYIRVCNKCQHLKWNNIKDQYSFKFNVFDYPGLFNLEQINQIGWVSFRGKNYNPNGLSRDHKISISDAKKYGYDPYYISHQCNCSIILQKDNNKKNQKSSITYEQLVHDVIKFNTLWGEAGNRTLDDSFTASRVTTTLATP